MSELFYPGTMTIFSTRYGGAYEHGEWAALSCGPEGLPPIDDICGNDPECEAWWDTARENDLTYIYSYETLNPDYIAEEKIYMALGDTPQEAYENLLARNNE